MALTDLGDMQNKQAKDFEETRRMMTELGANIKYLEDILERKLTMITQGPF